MKTIICLESAKDLLDAVQQKSGFDPLPEGSTLVFENAMEAITLQVPGNKIVLGMEVDSMSVIEEMGKRLGIKVHIT
jgi:hypothetical protein